MHCDLLGTTEVYNSDWSASLTAASSLKHTAGNTHKDM